MKPLSATTKALLMLSAPYALVWGLCVLLWKMWPETPWVFFAVFVLAFPLGLAWLNWIRVQWPSRQPETSIRIAVAATWVYLLWWQLAVVLADWGGMPGARASLAYYGTGGMFIIGLGWLIWWLERASRRFELRRIDERIHDEGVLVAGSHPQLAASDDPKRKKSWNPLDPQAWYYGRGSQKLKQSLLGFLTYALLFWLLVVLLGQVRGCHEIYEMPAGGGQQKQAVAQKVQIQKVIRKKFIINPLSAIKFNVPPIDEVKLQLDQATEHAYTIGYGEGTGAGFAGGTKFGKVRLIRLEYDGGDWALNHGVGGDLNMLFEYGILTQQKVAEQTESRRVSALAAFPPDKSPPVIFMTGQGSISVGNGDAKVLRDYLLNKHGMLFASAGTGHFHNQFIALMQRVLPDVRPVPIPLDDIIHRAPFPMARFPYVVAHGGKEPLGWNVDGRWVCYYHPGDISDAWADGHSGVSPEVYNGCYQLGANVINYGHTEYAKWLMSQQKK